VGIGVVEAARGRLVHRVEVVASRVTRYQILAPTEWNFHPQGTLVQSLVGMRVEGLDELYRQVRLIVSALDPCVAYELEGVGGA
jgi:Ni,Fe-hydrogenase I large subunit